MSSSPRQPAENIALSGYTTIGLGGPARYFFSCSTVEEIGEAIRFAGNRSLPMHVFSGGSNMIFRDEGFDGVVVHIGLRGKKFERKGSTVTATFCAGEQWDDCVVSALEAGYAGIECLSGIPGSAGATPIQNVGAYGQEVKETIVAVKAMEVLSGGVVILEAPACSFGYRTSRFKVADAGRFIILEVSFRLEPDGVPCISYPELQRELASADMDSLPPGRQQLERVRNAVLSLRRRKSMVVDPADPHSRSCGSFFVNPVLTAEEFRRLEQSAEHSGIAGKVPHFPAPGGVKIPAAWLVEQSGFPKGYRKGGAGVSAHHSLALVNYGCTANELLGLAGDIENTVFAKFNIRLQREPVVV